MIEDAGFVCVGCGKYYDGEWAPEKLCDDCEPTSATPRRNVKNERLTIRINGKFLAILKERAEQDGMSLTVWVEHVLRKEVER